MTEQDLKDIYTIWAQATQGEINTIHITQDVDPVEWFRECLSKSETKDLYGVACGTPESIENGDNYLVTAFTGNGPKSLANANFYAICHMVIPALVEEIRTLKIELEMYKGRI